MRTYQEAREKERDGERRRKDRAGWQGGIASERVATRKGIGEERNRERERAKRRDSWYSFDFGRAAVVSSGNPTFHSVSYYPFRCSRDPPRSNHSAATIPPT